MISGDMCVLFLLLSIGLGLFVVILTGREASVGAKQLQDFLNGQRIDV